MNVTLKFTVNGTDYLINTFVDASIQVDKEESSYDNLMNQKNVSLNFRVPLVGQLIDILGDLTDLTQESPININKEIKGGIIIDNMPFFFGSFQILKVYHNLKKDAKELGVVFTGDESNLKGTLSDLKLSEVFAAETLPYTGVEIQNYYDDPEGYSLTNGYHWPMIDYGQNYNNDIGTTGTSLNTTVLTQLDFKPSLTFRKIFDLVNVDITFDSEIDYLLEQHIPLHNNKSSIPTLDTSTLDYTGSMTNTTDYKVIYSGSAVIDKMNFAASTYYNINPFDLGNDEFDAPFKGFFDINISGTIDLTNDTATDGEILVGLVLYDYNGAAAIKTVTYFSFPVAGNTTETMEVNTTVKAYLEAGMNVGLRINLNATLTTDCTITFIEDFKFDVVRSPSVTADSNVLIGANCPELTVYDVLKTILIQCNGRVISNKDGTYDVSAWINWIDSKDENVIIEDGIEHDKDVVIEPFSLQGAKSIKLSYQADEDYFNKSFTEITGNVYGQIEITDTGSDFATKELKLELPFAASPIMPISSTSAAIPKFLDKDLKLIKTKPRVLGYSAQTMKLVIKINDVFGGTENGYVNIPFHGHWISLIGGYDTNDFNFGRSDNFFRAAGYPNKTLYEKFWRVYIEETYTGDSRQMTLSRVFSNAAIEELTFNEKYYYKGSKFRLTKQNGIELTRNEPIQCTFMKRLSIENIDKAPYYPYNIINNIVQWKDSSDNSVIVTTNSSDLEASCIAYGYYYDSVLENGIQQGQLLEI